MDKKNKYLVNVLDEYNSISTKKINYKLLEIISISFLKENNETLTTLKVNNEFKQELCSFIKEILNSKDENINNIINNYN